MNTGWKIGWTVAMAFAVVLGMSAQKTATSKPITVHIVKEVIPANLEIVPGSIQFIEPTGNNAIDADEMCTIRFFVQNNGRGDAYGCRVRASIEGSNDGLSLGTLNTMNIPAGQRKEIIIPISASMKTVDGSITLKFEVTEPQGFGTDEQEMSIATKAFVNPYLQIVDYSVTSSTGDSQLKKKVPFDLQLMLQNTQYGLAEDVNINVILPANVYMTDGQPMKFIPSLESGKSESLVYSLIVNNNYAGTTIPIQVELQEKYGRYSENRTINLEINQTLAANKIVVDAIEKAQTDIRIAQIGSVVDKNIPVTNSVNKNMFAIIIANEQYKHVASVPFARNDGEIFRQYCIKTLGVPEKNIKFIADATLNDITSNIKWIESITNVWDNPQVIFYYAGHGIPDESSKSAYLLPVDGIGTDVSTGYQLDELYKTLGNMPASQITVFMDACFSGSKREEGMLASARGVALKAKSGVPQGNMIVFSAAQGDETAYPNKEEGHGMFTYYLLKKLQETSGDITMQALGDYITTNVRRQSLLINGKSQTPTVTASATLGTDWQDWKLK